MNYACFIFLHIWLRRTAVCLLRAETKIWRFLSDYACWWWLYWMGGHFSPISHISQEGPGLPKFRVIFLTYPVKNLTLTARGGYNDCGQQIAYKGFNEKMTPPHLMRVYLPDQPPLLFHESLMSAGSQIHRFPALATGKIGQKRQHWFMQLNEWRA